MICILCLLPFKLLIYGYRFLLSPILGVNCCFAPSCSAYALEALDKHGPLRGGLLTVKRIGALPSLGRFRL